MIKFKRVSQTDRGGPYLYIGTGNGKSVITLDFTERKRPQLTFEEKEFPAGAAELDASEISNLLSELSRAALAYTAGDDQVASSFASTDRKKGSTFAEEETEKLRTGGRSEKTSDEKEDDDLFPDPVPLSMPRR